jgi:hypothetical protein
MANNTAVTQTTNIVPVQGIFAPEPTFGLITFIGPAGTPFLPPTDPNISGATITNSTINSTTIGATSPSTGNFTNISTTTGTISTTPSGNTDIANKGYVDSVAQGLDVKASCVYSTTNNITLSGLGTQAGGDWASSLTAGDRVLVKNQSSSQFNGIYLASATGWTRSADMNVWSEVPSAFTFIESGTTLADTGWVCTANQGGTIDVTAMPWSQFSGAGTYLAGDGLQLIGNTFSVKANGTTLDVSASGVKISDTYAGQTSITTLGTIATGTWNATTIAVNKGGTGLTSYTVGDLIYASGPTTLSPLNDAATGNALISGGLATAPTWGKIGLTTHVSGTLPIANGGTNAAATPPAGAVAYGTGTAYAFTNAGTTGQVLTSNGSGTPTWSTPSGGDVVGPASATDNAIARYDGTSGKLIQNSVTTIDDTGNASGILSQQFSNGSAVTLAAGKMWYDGSTGSWNLGMGGGNITQQVGEEQFIYGKASAAITDSPLRIVYHTGTVGASSVIQFAPTIAGITDVNAIIGVATENIANNAFGRITTFGVVRGITTNGTAYGETWADDDVIWYNPVTGNPTKVEPVAPNIKIQVGLVINAGSGGSGSFQVLLRPGSVLGGTDSNVQFGTLANNDLIQYSTSLGYWRNVATSTVTIGTATNLAGGAAASIPYQSATGTTAFLASGAGDANKVLQSNGTSAPSWVTPVAYATVTDDTTTNAVRYPLFANQTTGSLTTTLVSSTKYNYNPSSGLLTATGFSGSGASLTSLPAGQLSGTIPSGVLGNSSLYIGTTSIALNRSSSAQSLTGVNIDGSAGSATTAGTATNATNVAITDDTTTASDMYLSWVTSTTGNLPIKVSSTKLKFNPSTGVLTATGGVLGGTF